jgi:hypothetical protein
MSASGEHDGVGREGKAFPADTVGFAHDDVHGARALP